MKRKAIIITIVTTSLLAMVAIAAAAIPDKDKTSNNEASEDSNVSDQVESKRLNVKTEIASSRKLTEYVTVTGTAKALMDVTYSAEVPGRIEHLGPELGRKVRKGQVLAKVDYRTLRAQRVQALASYNLAKKTHTRLNTLGEGMVSRQKNRRD